MILDRLTADDDPDCDCRPSFDDDRLLLAADDCPGRGDLATEPACRATAIGALADRDADSVVVSVRGLDRVYDDRAVALLVAAGRFTDRVAVHDATLAARARRDPLRAARDATARTGPAADLAAETGLAAVADDLGATDPCASADYERALSASAVPSVARIRVDRRPPDGRLVDVRELETGGTARTYEVDAGRRYHLRPPALDLDPDALATLAAARDRLADGPGGGPDRAPARAVRAVAGPDDPTVALAAILRKHTRGYGVLADLFADDRVSDVYATAPVGETPLRVTLDGAVVPTNVTLTEAGARTLASRLRRESGRAFSRASPTIDATASLPSGRVRVAGVTDPVSEGVAFAVRDHGREAWTLPALVENGTVPPRAAALLSLAVERGAAVLVAGARGAGKTTTLGALLWELPRSVRTLVVEDTPELPVEALREDDRDVQALRTESEDGPGIDPAEALRTGLRLGESALVVGEVRGEEAAVLYEAMRVGDGDDAVLGTIHGDGAAGVHERVTADLGVPSSSFVATDLVVTLATVDTDRGTRRRLRSVEEVISTDEGVRFATLWEPDDDGVVPTGRVARGDSVVAADLVAPNGTYADLLAALDRRERTFADLARRDRTTPEEIRPVYADRRSVDGSRFDPADPDSDSAGPRSDPADQGFGDDPRSNANGGRP